MRLVPLVPALAVLALPAGAAPSGEHPGLHAILASNDDPTVDFRTDVAFVGDQTFTATFIQAGPALRVRLRAALAGDERELLRRAVRRLAAPPAGPRGPGAPSRITMRDRSNRNNFQLAGRGVNRRTGRAFTGVATWSVTL